MAALFDAVADDYEATGTEYFRPMGRRLVELAALQPGERVLDVGTGRGAVLRPAVAAVGDGGRVAGVDVSPRMAHLTSSALGAPVLVADAADPPLSGPFDAVVGGMVAQFLADPGSALRAWLRLVRPGGRLAVSWWAGDDERWAAVDAAVARHVSAAVSRGPRPFSGDVAATEALVRASGWDDVRTLVEEQDVVFTDVDAWWRWTWSHGQRRVWESVDDLPALRRDVDRRLADLADPDGRLRYRPRAAFTLANADQESVKTTGSLVTAPTRPVTW